MTRLHTDPVEVRSERDVPAQFRWRGRLYLVQEVLACWTGSGQWWRTHAVRSLTSGDSAVSRGPADRGTASRGPADRGTADRPLAPPAKRWAESASLAGPVEGRSGMSDVGGALSAVSTQTSIEVGIEVGIDDGERDWWRVEAGTGRHAAFSEGTAVTGVYDLCFDWARGSWSLARVLD